MDALTQIRRLYEHAAWADVAIVCALRAAPDAGEPWREYAHILGAESTWMARLTEQGSAIGIWPVLEPREVERLSVDVGRAVAIYVAGLDAGDLERTVTYRNSTGAEFTNTIGDVLLHVALHGQYHRGKVNAMLRAGGAAPAPTDFISFVRSIPVAGAAGAASA